MMTQNPKQINTIEEAESQVQQSRDRLDQALKSRDLKSLFVAINLLLHAEHVHGLMAERLDISNHTLKEIVDGARP